MNSGLLFLEITIHGFINLTETEWISNDLSEFSIIDMALVIKIGRLIDSGVIEIDSRLPA